MNRVIEGATLTHAHRNSHDPLRMQRAGVMAACSAAPRLETVDENAIATLDKAHLQAVDGLPCVSKEQGGTGVLFQLIGPRHERRAMPITANQPLRTWIGIFADPAMTRPPSDRYRTLRPPSTCRGQGSSS